MRDRAYIVLSLAMSLDGRLFAARGENRRLGSAIDLERLRTLRRWADTLIVGASTVRAIDPPMALVDAKPRVVVLSRKGDVPATARAFACDAHRPTPWLVTAQALDVHSPFHRVIDKGRLVHWRLSDNDAIDLARLVQRLRTTGSRRIVIEGGGMTAEQFLRADLLDELVLTYTPFILGGDDNSMTPTFTWTYSGAPRFKLHVMRRNNDELYTRWLRHFSAR